MAVLNMRGGKIADDRSYADWAPRPALDDLSSAGPAPHSVAERYVELYNTEPERFVRECYHVDYKVGAMGLGWYDDVEKFIDIEKLVFKATPLRRMRADCIRVTRTTVIVEAAVVDSDRSPNWELPFVAALEIRDDKIAVDRTYAELKKWPGIEGTI